MIFRKKVNQTATKEEILEEAMRANEDYFKAIAERYGSFVADRVRLYHERKIREDLADYEPGEVEIDLVRL